MLAAFLAVIIHGLFSEPNMPAEANVNIDAEVEEVLMTKAEVLAPAEAKDL